MSSTVELIIENGGVGEVHVQISTNNEIVIDTIVNEASQPLFYLRKEIILPNGFNKFTINYQYENDTIITSKSIFVMKKQWIHTFVRKYEEENLPISYYTWIHYMQPMLH
ncbi:MAG: hypothetical protein ACPG19_03490 [Saprospiraceae bacterium]